MMPDTTQVSILHRISNIVSSEISTSEMLGEIVGITAQVTGCDACLVYLFDANANEFVLMASQVPHAAEIGTLRIGMGEGVTGWVAEHKSAVALSEKANADQRFLRFPALVEDTYEAFLSVPLVAAGEITGVINVHHRQPHQHTSEEISLLTFVGEQMGGALSRARLEVENQRLQEEALEMKRQLETRKLVERAKGILQLKFSLTEEEAYLRLHNESRRLRRSMRDLAEAIILTEDLARKSLDSSMLGNESLSD
ncbi:MAG: GAF domain-containing protein [Bryobacterales bacterium]|nr:GAF domain-containing protein [Bryobacterales bacterium]